MPALRSVVFVVGAEIRVCHVMLPYFGEGKDSGVVVFVYVFGIIVGFKFDWGMAGVWKFFSLLFSWGLVELPVSSGMGLVSLVSAFVWFKER